jgi:hypothetical protein
MTKLRIVLQKIVADQCVEDLAAHYLTRTSASTMVADVSLRVRHLPPDRVQATAGKFILPRRPAMLKDRASGDGEPAG